MKKIKEAWWGESWMTVDTLCTLCIFGLGCTKAETQHPVQAALMFGIAGVMWLTLVFRCRH